LMLSSYYISNIPISPTTISMHQQDPIAGQQKAKEFSCHTPLTKDENRNAGVKNRSRPLGIAELDAT
jgi:hypothetical protein